MPNTWSQLLVHTVFSTKRRTPVITKDFQQRLYDFMGGIVRDLDASVYAIGGMPDHVHILIRYKPSLAVSSIMQHIKSRSSSWMHEDLPQVRGFGWQEGGGVFSVSKSQAEKIKAYIYGQEEHHTKQSFEDEYLEL